MKKLALFSLALYCAICAFAQSSLRFPFAEGQLQVQQYANNIFKLTYTNRNYTTNEHISDAVILKPLPQLNKTIINQQQHQLSFTQQQIAQLVHVVAKDGYHAFQFALDPQEQIFGGGERALPFNRHGYRFNLYNNPWYGYEAGADNLNYAVPFFTSNKGYALFFDNPSKGYADIGKTNTQILEVGFVSGELNVFVILGNSYANILQSYHQLTGTQGLPPRWAFGNLMSRFGYTSQQQVAQIAQAMQTEKIPFDAVIFDLFWFGDSIKQTMGNLDWVNKKAWPNPQKMIANFKQQQINTILITEPFVLKSSLNYTQSKKFHAVDSSGNPYLLTDFYFGNGGIIDLFRKDAQQWFWSKYHQQMQLGVEAWWGDLGEPEKHPKNLYHNLKDLGFKRLFAADEVHNLYGHTWSKMLYQQYAQHYPNKRLFSLNRSGFAGSQRFNIFPWTGDVSRSWSGFKAQLPILLGMSMSGVPYVHSDAGGFAGGDGDATLYIRWLQMAAFTPIFRPHGTALYDIDKQAFSYPSEPALMDTPYRAMAKATVNLRYSFLPYNYNLAYQQAKHGKPLMAPFYYYFSNDSNACKVEDAYMWGEQILVAPMLEKGATTRTIYLPKGDWYYYGERYSGEQKVTVAVPLERACFFVKAGSLLPLSFAHTGNTSAYNQQQLHITYMPSQAPSSYEHYMDDGVNKNAIAQNKYDLLQIASTGLQSKKCSFTITPKKQGYHQLKQISLNTSCAQKPTKVIINGKAYAIQSSDMVSANNGVQWFEEQHMLLINTAYRYEKLRIQVWF